ncbi:DUF1489 family protein [Methylobacterium pseudosasicola]|uniref:Lysophospholipase n=1 Tax=Methylobacterium pseudosasicola TaxID=582667 RepID=A0A1I4HYW2_9HYPH|nr:DUF1489 domain-containing protein [Methylobacterium pseudosasicola]SFL47335.1 hypothetical protein SAMN05192568_1005143 [Methylobacterium pseudosasicola]
MALNLIKLCVGPASIADLEARQERYRAEALREGRPADPFHVTRTLPKRHREIAGKGSIYWVIRGTLSCRQAITAIEKLTDEEGIPRCRLVFDSRLVPVSPRPCRPFQGWRYLTARDAPADLGAGQSGDLAEMPEALRRELVGLGLL